MVRTSSVDEKGMKKGTWTEEEDRKLKAYIERYGHWNWRQLPKFAGVARCGKSCRLRWMNYLRPGLKRGNYSKEEEALIIKLHEKLGNRWSAIAAKLPGRTDNEVKNYWHTNLKKRFHKIQPTEENPIGLSTEASQSEASQQEEQEPEISQVEIFAVETSSVESSSFGSSAVESSSTSLSSNRAAEDGISSFDSSFAESIESFWNEPFILDTSYNQKCHASVFDADEGFISFSSYLDDDIDLVNQWMEGPSRNNYC